jgi:cellulose synthase/poly-beta-1,6-N-acetylglucosamine synthase-like glycosyltransferase
MKKNKEKEYPNVSYAITVCNEHEELKRLLVSLNDFVDRKDQVVIQCDAGNTTEQVYQVIDWYRERCRGEFDFIQIPLNNDFASFKNNLKSHCRKEYVFQIDADEMLGDGLLMHLPLLLKENPDVDVFFLPRINIVNGLTESYAKEQNWNVQTMPFPIAEKYGYKVVNYPDIQARLMKNLPEIKWKYKVHEQLVGWKSHSNMGQMQIDEHFDIEDVQNWCLIHIKDIDRQKRQNEFYNALIHDTISKS